MALIEWLGDPRTPRAELVDGAADITDGSALVIAQMKAGSIVLSRRRHELRLGWSADDQGRERAIPPGEYRLRTTRIEELEKGVHWMASASGLAGKPLKFSAGETVRIEIDPAVHFTGKGKLQGRELKLGFSLMSSDRRGLSIYREDKRIAVSYAVLDAQGVELTKGDMNYG